MTDDEQYDDVRAILRALTFLDPQATASSERMPPEVWDRLQGSLAAASTERAGARTSTVVSLPTVTPVTSRPSRGMRWVGGLVAASVAVVAVGLAVGSLRGTDEGTVVVAGEGTVGSAPAEGQPLTADAPEGAAEAFSTPPLDDTRSSDADPDAGANGGTAVTPAARMVLASKTDYTPEQLKGQVVSLVKNAGFQTAEEAVAKQMPLASMPVEGGFTASWQALRACLTLLTNSADSQALVVDRGTYAGTDAGVVVAPASTSVDPDAASPSPTVTIDTRFGIFDVWVVDPECEQVTSLKDFALYAWQP